MRAAAFHLIARHGAVQDAWPIPSKPRQHDVHDVARKARIENDSNSRRAQFSREASIKADTILCDLLPEELIEPEHIKAVQLSALRAFQSDTKATRLATSVIGVGLGCT